MTDAQSPPPTPRIGTLKTRLRPAAESHIRHGHPWVYNESIRELSRPGASGDLAVIYDRQDRFLAIGLYDPDSPIRIRILHRGKPERIDPAWWSRRLRESLHRRATLFDALTTGFRLIHGESDGWPGLVLDRYHDVLVMKLYTTAWIPHLEQISILIQELHPARALILRLSRNICRAASNAGLIDGQTLWGKLENPIVPFLEQGLTMEADVLHGQKTGFFLDQRENRARVALLANGRSILNVFSFNGGFSLHAARGGAPRVVSLDLNPHALDGARRNFNLNQDCEGIRNCRHETIQADAFDWLAGSPREHFDIIILDPPAMAKKASDVPSALSGYTFLARQAVHHLHHRDALLVAASCSAHVKEPDFVRAIESGVRLAGASFDPGTVTRHPPDHPATFAEAHYLKCLYLRVRQP